MKQSNSVSSHDDEDGIGDVSCSWTYHQLARSRSLFCSSMDVFQAFASGVVGGFVDNEGRASTLR